jgi:hypothetical protein
MGRCRLDECGLGQAPVVGFCEHGNEHSVSIKCMESGLDDISNVCLGHCSRRPLVHISLLLNHCFRLSHFRSSERKQMYLPNPKQIGAPNSLKTYVRQAFRPRRENYSRRLFCTQSKPKLKV